MVRIIDDWEVFARYAKYKVGFYRIFGVDKNIEVRVLAGQAGFIKEFESATDPLLMQILDFCQTEKGFLKVSETVRDEVFFN